MILTPKLGDGESFVAGRSTAKARELVEAAEKAGLPSGSVRTTSFGYIVPSELAEGGESITAADQPAVGTEPETPTNPDEVHNVDQSPEGTDPLQTGTADETDNGDNVDQFDPSTATVDEVKEYLEGADDDEFARVIEAEKASAKPRKGVLDLAAPEGE